MDAVGSFLKFDFGDQTVARLTSREPDRGLLGRGQKPQLTFRRMRKKTKAATSSPRRRFPSATVRLREDETFSLILVGRHCTSISLTMLALKQI